MMKIKTTLFSITLIFSCLALLQVEEVRAQDPIFSQFYAAPLQLNPAMTGVYNGRFRVVANYKQQWNSILDTRPFRTISASYDMRYRIGRGDFLAFGVTALQDEAGQSNFQRTGGELSVSYMKQLDGSRYRTYDQFLIGGMQVGVGQMSLDHEKLWFTNQFDTSTETINFSAPTDPELINASGMTDMYLNANVGLMWYAVFDDNMSLYFGGALQHINAPQISFTGFDGKEVIPARWVGQVGGELPFNRQLSILPAVMVTGQGPSMLSIFGFNLRYTNRDWREVAIRAGVWPHLVKDEIDSIHLPNVTFTTILELERLQLGLSYDVNANKLSNPTNGRGAFELSVIYVHPATRKEKVNCPKM